MTHQHATGEDTDSVLVVSQRFPPESMAGSHRWKKLVDNLPDGFESRVLCPHPSVPVGEFDRTWKPIERDQLDEIPVTRLWTYQPVEDRSNLERILNHVIFAVFASLYVLFNFRKYDTVVVQIGPHTTLLPGLTAFALRRRLIVDSFDLWLDNAADLGFINGDSLIYRIVEWFERTAIENSSHFIVLTETMGRQYQAKYDINESDWTPVPFGVDPEVFPSDLTTEEQNRVVYTGKLGEGQAFKPFLRGFKELNTNHELVIYGFGERHEELRTFCEEIGLGDRVQINGPVPRTEIPEILASSMVSLVPLKTEYALDYARPTKLLESMAVGTPYVASNVTEIEIVTQESNAGIAVENEPGAVLEAIEELLTDAEKRQRMGEQAVEYIDKYHRWDVLGMKVGSILTA